MWTRREPFWKDLAKFKRFGRWVAMATLSWGGLMGLYLAVNSGTSLCPDLSLACLQGFVERHLWWHVLLVLLGGTAFGAFTWIVFEWEESWAKPTSTPKAVQNSETQDEGLARLAQVSVSHLPSVSDNLGRMFRDHLLFVFIDGEPYTDLPFGETVVLTVSPGVYEMYVGYENHKSLWKRCFRTQTLTIDLEPGQTCAFQCRRKRLIDTGVLVMMLFLLFVMATDSLWEAYVTELMAPYLNVSGPVGLYTGAFLAISFLVLMEIAAFKPGGIYQLVCSKEGKASPQEYTE